MLSEVFDEKIVCTHICINTLYSILPNLKARDKILKLSQGNTFRVHVLISQTQLYEYQSTIDYFKTCD